MKAGGGRGGGGLVVAASRGKLEDDERPAVPDLSDRLPPTARRHGGKPDGKKKKRRSYGSERTRVQYEAVHRGDETRAELIEGGGP